MEHKKAVVDELHKPARRNYKRRKFDLRDIDETWQADLVEMIPYAYQKKGYKYLLTVIDVFSKFAWTVPVKSKNGKEEEKLKASICERFNRTLKNEMWKSFSLQGTYKWIEILQDLTSKYNNTKHRTIGMKPINVNNTSVNQIRHRLLKQKVRNHSFNHAKFKIGDKVRISRNKTVFEKGYTPNWSTEIFTIDRVPSTVPFTYQLKDYQDKPIAGGFYEEELLKTKCPDIYLVEKV